MLEVLARIHRQRAPALLGGTRESLADGVLARLQWNRRRAARRTLTAPSGGVGAAAAASCDANGQQPGGCERNQVAWTTPHRFPPVMIDTGSCDRSHSARLPTCVERVQQAVADQIERENRE